MSEEVQSPGSYAPPVTPLIPAGPSDRLDKCLDSYATSVKEIEKYSTLITSRDIQRDCEGKSSSEYKLMIWQAALSLNQCAIKEAIMCIIPLAVEVVTGKGLPTEISELIYDLLFFNKGWISHQLRNNRQDEYDHQFLNSTKRGHVCMEDVIERQPMKKRRIPTVKDPQSGYSNWWKRSSEAQEQIHNHNLLDRNEMATMHSPAKQNDSGLGLKPAESPQSLLSASEEVASSPDTHTSGPADTWEESRSTERMESSTTALSSVQPSKSLSSRSDCCTQFSQRRPSTATNKNMTEDDRDSRDFNHSNSTSDGEDEEFMFHTNSLDLYFKTGIEI